MRFVEFKKIPRLSREILVSEKIDGSNGQIVIMSKEKIILECEHCDYTSQDFIDKYCLYIHPDNPHVEEKDRLYIFAASRNRWLNVGKQNDNHAFAYWVKENAPDLVMLGEGRHFGEWYGKGIQRGYGLEEKRFALFNVSKWQNRGLRLIDDKQQYAPVPCEVVPVLYEGKFETELIYSQLHSLYEHGSVAVPGYLKPEGIVIYHTAAGQYFKKTINNDSGKNEKN
jgi:hypothetical protein